MTTFDILQDLHEEVGVRRASTPGENKAQQWLKAHCEQLGLAVKRTIV